MSVSLIDRQQYSYLRKRNLDCGIVQKPKTDGASARITNANPSLHDYPWMVYIFVKWYKDENLISPNDNNYGILYGSGSFITEQAVLTCGHCVCNEDHPTKDNPYLYNCGSEDPDGINQVNLNVKDLNEIHISFGIRTKVAYDGKEFDDNIEAYVYRYEINKKPSTGWRIIRNYGDVGIIKTKQKIDMQKTKISPICLPAPETFKKKVVMDVKFVGWGYRSNIEYESTGELKKGACYTNGARETSQQFYPDQGGISIVPCAFDQSEMKFCFGGQSDSEMIGFKLRQIHTFSHLTGIMFNENMMNYIKEDSFYKECVEYMKIAENKWVNAKKFLHSDKSYKGFKIFLFEMSIYIIKMQLIENVTSNFSCIL